MRNPKVLIEVNDGVASYRVHGKADVCLVDYDVIALGEEIEVPEEFYKVFEGLRESVQDALQTDEHGSNRCTSRQES